MFTKSIFLAPFVLAALVNPAFAQDSSDLTPAQIEELFSQQRTRGLVLAPKNSTSETVAQQDDIVKDPAQDAAATYVELPKNLQVNVKVNFDFDSASLRQDQKPKLAALCQAMKSNAGVFRIVGHTDSSGSAEYNQRLSLLRAEEVKRHLVSECGIPATQLEALGAGEDFPFNTQDPRADENRRVEFQALS